MQRQLLGAALLALALVGTGCNPEYVAGRCDCQYNPANAVIAPASNPYPVIGGPSSTVAAPATTMPMAIPPATTGK